MRYLFLLCLILQILLAQEASFCAIEGESALKAWTLANYQVSFVDKEGNPVAMDHLRWKLFSQGKDLSTELRYRETDATHQNSFRPTTEGVFTLEVFQKEDNTPFVKKEIQVTSSHDALEIIATRGPAHPDLGYVKWVEDLSTAKKIAAEKKVPLLLGFFTCCVASERIANFAFRDPEFLALAEQYVVVPMPLGNPKEQWTEDLYQVLSGLSFVVVNSEGIYIDYIYRPSMDKILDTLKKGLEANQTLLEKAEKIKKELSRIPDDSPKKIQALFQAGCFYRNGKSYAYTQDYFEQALAMLARFPNPEFESYLLTQILDLYIRQAAANKVIQLIKERSLENDYALMCLGMAYYIKRTEEPQTALEKSKGYFEALLAQYPNSTYTTFSQEMIKEINNPYVKPKVVRKSKFQLKEK
ncbi:MAG: outer membrane protein assembly factor BamD [Planctomycetota bacterium]